MNAPNREEAVELDINDVRVGFKKDAKVLHSADFILCKEDHTMGNLLRMKLLELDHVRFAGYRHPHPLETLIEMKVRTDGTKAPVDAVLDGLNDLVNEFTELRKNFAAEVNRQQQEDSTNYEMH